MSNLVADRENIRMMIWMQLACAHSPWRTRQACITVSNSPADLGAHFNAFEDIFPEQGEHYDDAGMRDWPSVIRKRTYALFADTITSSVEVLDHILKPALEDSRSAKRRSA